MRSGLAVCWSGLALVACGSAPVVEANWFERAATGGEPDPAAFEGAAELLRGFDPPGETTGLAAGDRALYGLELREGARVTRWLMEFEILEPIVPGRGWGLSFVDATDGEVASYTCPIARVGVSRFDAAGTRLDTTEVFVPHDGLVVGLAPACELRQDLESDPSVEPVFHRSIGATLALVRLIEDDELLSEILWRVARRPSLWSIMTSAGVSVSVGVEPENSRVLDAESPHGGTVHRLPIVVEANDSPALLLLADVTAPTSPLNVGGGTLSLAGSMPGDDSVRFSMRLLAARRGPR